MGGKAGRRRRAGCPLTSGEVAEIAALGRGAAGGVLRGDRCECLLVVPNLLLPRDQLPHVCVARLELDVRDVGVSLVPHLRRERVARSVRCAARCARVGSVSAACLHQVGAQLVEKILHLVSR